MAEGGGGSPYNHYSLYRCTLSALHYFPDLESIVMARDGENTTYEYPDCHFPITGQDYEETRVTLVEKFAGTAAYDRPLTCHVVRGASFADAAITVPANVGQELLDVVEVSDPRCGIVSERYRV
jgi:hypothetical protein